MCQAFYIERCWLAGNFKLRADSTLNELTVNGQTPLGLVPSFVSSGPDAGRQYISGVGF